MTNWWALRCTLNELILATVLLCLSLTEMLFSDEQPKLTVLLAVAAVAPPVAVAVSRSWPKGAAAVCVSVSVLGTLQGSLPVTFGAGFAYLAIAFGLSAWSRHPWRWLVAIVSASTLRDLYTAEYDLTDVLVDWAFVGFTIWIGRTVHRRTSHANVLTTQLELADVERETRTQEAVARERAVIARELHDIVAHSVSIMVVQASSARPIAQRADRELAEVFETIEHAGREALTELRRLLHVLRAEDDPDLQPIPDLSRLDGLLDGVRRAGVEVQARVNVPSEVPPGVALCAYRTVQEGLTNAMRYADGSRVEVEVTGDARTLIVRVGDFGGSAAEPGQVGTGTGLVGLQERVLLCGGHMCFRPTESGHLLEVVLPVSDQTLLSKAPLPRPRKEQS